MNRRVVFALVLLAAVAASAILVGMGTAKADPMHKTHRAYCYAIRITRNHAGEGVRIHGCGKTPTFAPTAARVARDTRILALPEWVHMRPAKIKHKGHPCVVISGTNRETAVLLCSDGHIVTS